MITDSLESTLRISGGSASVGRLESTLDTRSRMSLAAESTLRPTLNSTVMSLRPSWLEDSMYSMPSTPAMRSSRTSVMRVSTTEAAAPR